MLRSLLLFGILFSHFSFLTAQEEDFIDSELNRTLEEERQSIDRRALQRPTPEDRNTEEAGLENTLQREEKALSQEELEKREEAEAQQITRNLDAALRNYERLIENQPKSQASTYKTRLNENQKLLQERQTRLNMSEDQLRQAKIELLGRYLRLKKAYEAGKLTERIFKKKESEILEQYSYSKQALENDIALYQKDINEAEERIHSLQETQKIHELEYPELYKEQPKKYSNPLENLLVDFKKHSRFQLKNAFSSASPQDFKAPHKNADLRHLTALYNRAIIAHDMDDFMKSKILYFDYLRLAENLSIELTEEDIFQAAYLSYLTKDWKNARQFTSQASRESQQELASIFNDRLFK